MFRPQIQKTRILFLLAVITMGMVYWAVNSYEQNETYGYDVKLQAVDLMENAINSLREEFIYRGINNGDDSIAFGSFLIGDSITSITTLEGAFESKLSTINPNFAAMITEMFFELELDSSSKVAVSYTGSYPGGNIAVLSALEAMNIDAAIISSCGASSYGATYPEMTWIDIEHYLFEMNQFSNKSNISSIGGGLDIGSQLKRKGKKVCEDAIYSNKLNPLFERNPINNVNQRLSYYSQYSEIDNINLFINVGGGVYVTGDRFKRSSLPGGIIYPGDINLDSNKTVLEQFLEREIPVININQIDSLTAWYELPYPHNFENKVKEGSLFYSQKKYNFKVILIALIISAGIVFYVGIMSHLEIKKRMHASEPDSIL